MFGRTTALRVCLGLAMAGCVQSDGDDEYNVAAVLLRCKIGELEEAVLRGGLPEAGIRGEDDCCAGAAIAGHRCAWEVAALPPNEEDLSRQLLGLGGAFGTHAAPAPELGAATEALAARLQDQARRVIVRVRFPAEASGDESTSTQALEVTHLLLDARATAAPTPARAAGTAADGMP